MKKKLLFLLLSFVFYFVNAQEKERVTIYGIVRATKGSDIDGISIYNQSSQKGAITIKEGAFNIQVALKDSIIVSALQFKSFSFLIQQEVIDSRTLEINLNEFVNVLDEVVILKKDFTKGWDLSYKTLEFGYEFAPDLQSSIPGSVAEDALNDRTLKNGINIIGLVVLGVSALIGKKNKEKPKPKIRYSKVVSVLKEKYDTAFFTNTFNIPKEYVNDYIYFVGEEGIQESLLLPENEILFLEYLNLKSKTYLNKKNDN